MATLPRMAIAIKCLVEGYTWIDTSRINLRFYFMHWHMEDTIVVLNKGPGPHPRYEQCDMFIPQEAMAAGHLGTAMCKIGSEKKHRRLAATVNRLEVGTEFQTRDQVLEKVDIFKYLVRMLYFDDSDLPAVDRNLQIERMKRARLSCLIC